MDRKEQIIQYLNLQPHPEGGYYKETYRSKGSISQDQLSGYDGKRNHSTCIYFLLTQGSFSAWHKIRQDEIWHFYDGDPVELHMISPEGEYSRQLIGRKLEQSEVPQFVVPGGYWFASTVITAGSFSLVGCTVAPGFDFADFALAEKDDLIAQFPQHESVISRFTRPE